MSIFLVIELSSIILFTIYFYHAYCRDALLGRFLNTKFLLLALLYAFIFENLSIIFFAGLEGGYYYNDSFSLFVHKTPLFIVLLWSLILYSSYQIVKNTIRQKRFIFLLPLYVLALDIVMDVVAVQMGLWTWIGFEDYNGFFSVPASNYIGWLLTSFFFVFWWEKLKTVETPKLGVSTIGVSIYLQPFLAYLSFILSILPLHFLKINFFDNNLWMQYGVLFLLIIFFVVLFIVKNKGQEREWISIEKDYLLFLVRVFIHGFSLWGIIYLDLYKNLLICLVFFLLIISDFTILYKYKKTDL